MRKNGCFAVGEALPSLNAYQCGTYVVFTGLVITFYKLLLPMIADDAISLFLNIFFTIVICMVAALDLVCTFTDPSDANVLRKQKLQKEGKPYDDARDAVVNGEHFFCTLCEVSVEKQSKHCRGCDKCICQFDHHCKWLNNCVGKANYKPFFLLISSTFTMVLIEFCMALALFVLCFKDIDWTEDQLEEQLDGGLDRVGFAVTLGVLLAVYCVVMALLGELVFFHIILLYKGMTTYDYILAEKDRVTAQPPPADKGGVCTVCRSGKVQPGSTGAPKRVKVGIDPCALLKVNAKKAMAIRQGSKEKEKGDASTSTQGEGAQGGEKAVEMEEGKFAGDGLGETKGDVKWSGRDGVTSLAAPAKSDDVSPRNGEASGRHPHPSDGRAITENTMSAIPLQTPPGTPPPGTSILESPGMHTLPQLQIASGQHGGAISKGPSKAGAEGADAAETSSDDGMDSPTSELAKSAHERLKTMQTPAQSANTLTPLKPLTPLEPARH